jgi:exopolysaccharide production protein ExoZ
MNRLESLDWLRGLLALSIMVYHLTGWKLHQPDADTLLGRLGIYGVSMFFLLSGLAMAAGYAAFIHDRRSALRFYVRRVFRIWPLLWVAVAAVTLGGLLLKNQAVDWVLVVINLTTLFGFIDPGAYINTGAWSIGNEMVYYALTPPFLVLYGRSTLQGNLLVAATVGLGLYFGFWALDTERTLASQWQTYINPFNNLFFYATGMALYFNTRHVDMRPTAVAVMLSAACALLAFYPVRGDLITTVTDFARVVFFVASAAIVLAFYKLTVALPGWMTRPLAALGAATYGVYLLHPIAFQFVQLCLLKLTLAVHPYVVMTTTIALTIVVALVLYQNLELPLIRLGKRLTARPAESASAAVRLDRSRT